MTQLTSLIILTGAAALAACASQAPAPVAATGASQERAAVASAATSANQASSPATASATAQNDKFDVPSGYETVVVNGGKLYCHNAAPAGSRIAQRECLTQDQLEQRQREAELYLENAERQSGATGPSNGGNGPF